MNCYIDSSVVLRMIFSQSQPLKEWNKIRQGFSSRLLRLECLRTLDRLRLVNRWSPLETSNRLAALLHAMNHIGMVPLTTRVLEKAELSSPVPLGSLDSIHLASALLWREKHGDDFVFDTHDLELGLAVRACGLDAIGFD